MFFIAMLLATAEPSIQAIAEPAGGTVGFAAVELASGRSLGLKQNEPFPMQSVFKLPIAIEVLRQVPAHNPCGDERHLPSPGGWARLGL
jgi:beta-lactamase class A